MRLKKEIGIFLLSFFVFGASVGCGPILSTSRISEAKDALAAAESVNAAELAPYEYTSAQEFLKKADELWGYSKFGDSADYAKRSIEFAKAAEKKAQEDPWVNPLADVKSEDTAEGGK